MISSKYTPRIHLPAPEPAISPVSFSCRSFFSSEFYYYLATPKTSPFPMLKQQLPSPSHLALPVSSPCSGPSPCQWLDLTWGRLPPLPCTVKCSFHPACSWEGGQPWEKLPNNKQPVSSQDVLTRALPKMEVLDGFGGERGWG